jgi:hypothetical protein
MEWINRKVRLAWLVFTAAIIIAAIGITLEWQIKPQSFNPKYVTSLGIVLFVLGISRLAMYLPGRRSPQAAVRVAAAVNDERKITIRDRAAYGAYCLTAVLVVIGMFWVGGAEHRGQPFLSADIIWYYLAALFLLPFCFYAVSIIYHQRHR